VNLDNQTLVRTISRGCPTSLDPADDTNSAADFTLGTGSPRSNSATPTETQCPATPPATKKKCKKHKKKKNGAYSAKKKKCKKKKHH
jgi:Tfp pilus assembly protein PilW